MRLTATLSGEVAQMLASASSKWGLNREARPALLRVRTEPECPEDNLRQLMWDSNSNCGIARGGEKKKKERERERENFPIKSSNLRHCQPTHRTKDWGNTRGELAGYGLAHPLLEAERQAGDSQSQQGAISAPETASSTKLRAGSQLLTKFSWDGWHLPGGSQPEISSPEETHGTLEMVLLLCTQETEHLGRGGGNKMHCPIWGECACQAPSFLSCEGLGRAQNTGWTKSVPLWNIQEPEPEWLRPGKCIQAGAGFREFPCRATWSVSSIDWESTHAVTGGNPSVARHCEDSGLMPYMPVIFVCSVLPSPQHNWTSEPK